MRDISGGCDEDPPIFSCEEPIIFGSYCGSCRFPYCGFPYCEYCCGAMNSGFSYCWCPKTNDVVQKFTGGVGLRRKFELSVWMFWCIYIEKLCK